MSAREILLVLPGSEADEAEVIGDALMVGLMDAGFHPGIVGRPHDDGGRELHVVLVESEVPA